ncbi:urea transporter [Bacillus sp. S3]|uniref:urea transporter n=1 Tax=Bacillus sp. S3 TaxID=486398 RepID=UPI001CC1DAB0|nr:urea transporter [Bacillus sp. S3]
MIIHNNLSRVINRETLTWLMVTALKGISQVVLVENAVSGFIIFAAVSVASVPLGLITLFSALIGTLIAKIGKADPNSVNQGIFGYNSVLTGMALYLFLSGDDRWIIALIGAAITAFFTAAMIHFMRQTGVPILTFPYIILTWFFLLTTYRLTSFQLSPDLTPQSLSNWTLNIKGEANWLDGAVNGIGQVFFLDHSVSGILLFIALFWAGWRIGLYAIVGNLAALVTSYGLGGEHSLIFMGLYGYNAILTIIAVSLVFNDNHKTGLIFGTIAACITVPITASIVTWLLPYGLPPLTMPFVFCTWLFLGARKVLPAF